MTRTLSRLGFATLLLAASGSASGESLTFTETIPLQATGWSHPVSIPQFDPSLGDLYSAVMTLTGRIAGTAAFENLDSSPANVSLLFAADLTLFGPEFSGYVLVSPGLSISEMVEPYDGVTDFAGPSGRTYPDLATESALTFDLEGSFNGTLVYVGTGMMDFLLTSAGESSGSGAENLLLQFDQSAGATVAVTYTYEVPEPGMATLLIAGVFMGTRRRRRGSQFVLRGGP